MSILEDVLISGTLLVGTGMQGLIALGDLRRLESEMVKASDAIDELKSEVSRWRPIRFYRHRKLVKELLRESKKERADWRSIRARIVSWALIATVPAVGLVQLLP